MTSKTAHGTNPAANPAKPANRRRKADGQRRARTTRAKNVAPAQAPAKGPAKREQRPLFRPLPPAPEFPLEALGPLQPAAEALHDIVQAPPALCAQCVLATTTLAVQFSHDVRLPGGAGTRPLVGMFVSIAGSGERKTTADNIALRPVQAVEQEWMVEHQRAQTDFLNEQEAWDLARKAAKNGTKDQKAIAEALKKTGAKPQAPRQPLLLLADATAEGITRHFEEGRPWAGLFSSEGGLIVGGYSFRDESRMMMGASLNSLWDGSPIRRARAGTGMSYLAGLRLSAHLMMQPGAAARLVGDPMLNDLGLGARLLIVAPESTAGSRLFKLPSAVSEAALAAYNERITTLLKRPPRFRDGATNMLDPLPLPLSEEATTCWIDFFNEFEGSQGEGGALAPIRAWASKAAEHAGRLAAVLTLYADSDATEVGVDAMRNGIELARHYAEEMLRLAGSSHVQPDLWLAQEVLDWLREKSLATFHLAQVYQSGPSAVRDAETARRMMDILAEHGLVEALGAGTVIDGVPRKEAWRLTD